jgi:hypothetical protein
VCPVFFHIQEAGLDNHIITRSSLPSRRGRERERERRKRRRKGEGGKEGGRRGGEEERKGNKVEKGGKQK